jgi:hypothetical protein
MCFVLSPSAESETEYLFASIDPIGRRHTHVIPAVRVVTALLNLPPRDTDVAAVLATPRLPEAVAKANISRITILPVAAGPVGLIGHHPCRVKLLVNERVGRGMIVLLSANLG